MILSDKYELVEKLGEGTTGEVYRIKDIHMNRMAAMKVFHECELGKKELDVLMRLRHPGLPLVYDYFEEEKKSYLVMELIEGLSLRQYLDKFGKVEQEYAIAWAEELLEIFAYLHEQRPTVIYRDLKPSNIMVDTTGHIKLIDLGAALLKRCSESEDKDFAGTPAYGAPEQWKNEPLGVTADLYSFGAVFHEMLTGNRPDKPPFDRRPLTEYKGECCESLATLIDSCLCEKPKGRPGSAVEAIKMLKQRKHYEKIKRLKLGLKKLGLTVLLGGLFYSFLTPLVKGLNSTDFPYPYLYAPAVWMILTAIYLLIGYCFRKKNRSRVKNEKDYLLTEKMKPGLMGFCFFILGLMCSHTVFAGEKETSNTVHQAKETLWVEVCDEHHQNVLVKEGEIYEINEEINLRLLNREIPADIASVQLVAYGNEGEKYESRRLPVSKKSH